MSADDWTENEDKAIEYGWRNGISFERMALAMGRPASSVSDRFSGFIARQPSFRRPSNVKWTKVMENRLMKMHKSGLSVAEIAKSMNRTYGAIHYRLFSLGVDLPVDN